MIKQFCDFCGKEITNDEYVEQVIYIHYELLDSVQAIICKSCWEKESNSIKIKENKQ